MDRMPFADSSGLEADLVGWCFAADRLEPYQCAACHQIPLEHREPLTVPCDFDHTSSKVRWTPHFNDGLCRK